MKGSIFAVLAAATVAAVSCKKEEPVSPAIVTSTVEIQLSNPTTKAFGSSTAEAFEKKLNNVIVFVYEDGKDTCSLVREFTQFELEQQKAVFTIPHMKANMYYEFYAVANCTSAQLTDNVLTTTRIKKSDLLKVVEGDDVTSVKSAYGNLSDYNSTAFGDVSMRAMRGQNAADNNKGFIMSGMDRKQTPAKGTNEPTHVKLELRRTVAKVEVQASLSEEFHNSGKYPAQSTLKITNAKLINLAQSTTLIANTNPTITLWENKLEQNPNVVTGATYAQYQNLFYIYETGVNTSTVADANKPVLVLEAEFDFDGKAATTDDQTKLTYNIKLAGEAAATGNGSSPEATAPNFGLFLRNGSYLINVSIKGLTENEVVASIEVQDWETLKTQNVQIGQ